MNKLIPALLLLFCLTILLVSYHGTKKTTLNLSIPMPQNTYLEKEIGRDASNIIYEAKTVFFFSVSPNRNPPHFKQTSPKISLSDDLTKEFQQLLFNHNNYVQEMSKLTMFLPSLAFEFHKDNATEENLLVLICPEGNQIKVIYKKDAFILDYDPAQIEFTNFLQKLENKSFQ